MNPQPGEVWLADLGLAAKTRPIVIVSRDDPDPPRALILYVPLTTQNRQSPHEVALPHLGFLDRDSVASVQMLGSLPKVRLERRLGKLPHAVMAQIERSRAFALDLIFSVLAKVQYLTTYIDKAKISAPQYPFICEDSSNVPSQSKYFGASSTARIRPPATSSGRLP
jgi:mRNA interferase MazF